MAKITQFKGYQGEPPIPKPSERVLPNVVTVQDGVPVKYPGCEGIGVRVVHPTNPKASSQNMGLTVFYVPPHVVLEVGSHHTEECYAILRGQGTMTLAWGDSGSEGWNVRPPAVLVRARAGEHG